LADSSDRAREVRLQGELTDALPGDPEPARDLHPRDETILHEIDGSVVTACAEDALSAMSVGSSGFR